MNELRCLIILPFAAMLAGGQSAHKSSASNLSDQAEALTRTLYKQVVAHKPIGTMRTADRKIFAPYLSEMLNRRMSSARACEDDFFRQHPQKPDLPEKPPFAWLELGTFSGGDDEDALRSFQIEKTESKQDGSVQVYVRLRWGSPQEKPWFTRVAVVVTRENSRFVVNDLIYMGEESDPYNQRLSEALSTGCRSGHWVRYDDPGNKPKQ